MQKQLHKNVFLISLSKTMLLFTVSFFMINMAHATNWYVNDASTTGDVFTTAIGNDANPGTAALPFATIQFAINSATAGDVIFVDAGTYTADATISKSLTLRGAKFGINAGPAAVPVNRGTDETIVVGTIYYGGSIDNITVDGFTVNRGSGYRGIDARGLNSVVINNIVTGTIDLTSTQAGISTRANGPLRLHSYIIANNNVTGFRDGMYFDGNLENPSQVVANYFSGNVSGIVATGSDGHQFKGNLIENNIQGMTFTKGSNSIEENTFRGNTNSGVRLVGSANLSNNSITNNFFENNGIAINLTNPDPASTNNQAHYNSFTGNTANIVNTHAANFNATCNWYGSINPIVIAAQISGNVTFNPFLTDGIDSDLALDGFQPITTCVVLPVILTSFSAVVKNYDVLLNWQTASEVNSSHFIVERSTDNQVYNNIGRVEAKGFSDVKINYGFTDDKPMNFDRPTFYRLVMVDRDGTKKYSKIISVILKTNGSYLQKVYPNPARAGSMLQANFISGSAQKIGVSFVNATGQILQTTELQAHKGTNQFNVPVPASASAGVNFLMIKSTDNVKQVPVYIY